MIRLNKKQRKYQSPSVKVTQMVLESNFCQTNLRLNVQVDQLENVNADSKYATEEAFYFDQF